MKEDKDNRSQFKVVDKTLLAIKAIRMLKGLNRVEAAKKCGWSSRAFEQLENGRCNYTEARIKRLVDLLGASWDEFEVIRKDPKKMLAVLAEHSYKERALDRKPRRNHYKIVTKEVRVIRELRMQRGISQYEASRRCGYVPSAIGQIECGRINLTPERIQHILVCIGSTRAEFDRLLSAPVLRDEVIRNCLESLTRMDETKLESAVNVIKALGK